MPRERPVNPTRGNPQPRRPPLVVVLVVVVLVLVVLLVVVVVIVVFVLQVYIAYINAHIFLIMSIDY